MASTDGGTLLAIKYVRGRLELLDQRKLPHETTYVETSTAEAGWHAIKDMVVRGAPAIAIAAALALAAELVSSALKFSSASEAADYIQKKLEYLVSSRPTAVNLFEAAKRLKAVISEASQKSATAESVVSAYLAAAEQMMVDDVADNKAIGAHGSEAIVKHTGKEKGLRVLTHCNTGSLATAAYGTALGVIRSLHAEGKLERAYCTETRPYNQGSRLTAYELVYENIPATLIADSAAASLQRLGGIDAIVVGADRIAANGDTANKIGTYSLALAAKYHNIPFFIAAPFTSIDTNIRSGNEIKIEERDPKELTHASGGSGPPVAAPGIGVWNPSFDVTPGELITGIITEKGVIEKLPGASSYDIAPFLLTSPKPMSAFSQENGASSENTKAYYPLDVSNLGAYVQKKVPAVAQRLGGDSKDWSIKEVGDGNLNLVYIVQGASGAVVIKQSLPYVRCVGESWPLTVERAAFEAMALQEEYRFCPQHVPEVYFADWAMALIAMRYIEPPHIILRKGLIAGTTYPLLSDHISTFMAETLFKSSLLSLTTSEHKALVAKYCSNVEMCRLTEQVIFTDPYYQAPNNHWTSPQLDDVAASFTTDSKLKVAISELKAKFCEQTQALLHGDLHTGSIMVTQDSTQVIDPEFAYYGPMGFDIGAYLANLFLAIFSQEGHAKPDSPREEYVQWLLQTTKETWELFTKKFLSLWKEQSSSQKGGDLIPPSLFGQADGSEEAYQQVFMREVFLDSLGFAAAKMIRRIVGIAHVEDLESITDREMRAKCEKRALKFARVLLLDRQSFSDIASVLDALDTVRQE